ncbi:nucleolar protein 8-like [Gigantopelta aegis]|uniref:nucleolar protein 8-like n=1 Tax=Gigantopelta aegis TaxID=1735272 RepID=UPI001B88C0FA|nr:nucleolar protein 8-like [Gigantopelta aegis]
MTDKGETQKRRIHVGGLFPTITASELGDKFSKFGTVANVEVKIRKNENGTPEKTFAYVDFVSTEANWKKCLSTFNHTKWKGSELKLALAKPSFLEKLADERQHGKDEDSTQQLSETSHLHNPLQNLANNQSFELRGAVPGTPIPGEKNWVVGKYGRILPILHLKKDGKQKLITHDPSKYCHSLKRLKDDDISNVSPTDLTWEITHTDSAIMKKQKGNFKSWASKKKTHTDQNYLMLKKFYDKKLEQSKNGVNDESDSDDFEVVQVSNKVNNDDNDDSADSADTDEIIANTQSRSKMASKSSHGHSEQYGTSFVNTDNSITDKSSKPSVHNSLVKTSESLTSRFKSDSPLSKNNSSIKTQQLSKSSTHNPSVNMSDSLSLRCKNDSSLANHNSPMKSQKMSFTSKYSSSLDSSSDTSSDRDHSSVRALKKKLADSTSKGNGLESPAAKQAKHSETFNTKSDICSPISCTSDSRELTHLHGRSSSKSSNSCKWKKPTVPEFKGLSMLTSDSENNDTSENISTCQINTGVNSLIQINESADADISDTGSDAGSANSADTDDIISNAKKNIKTKCKEQRQKWWNSMDEYSPGFSLIDVDVSYTQRKQQTDDDSDDDDVDDDFAKLSKLVERTDIKILSSTPNPVAMQQKVKGGLSLNESSKSCEDSFSKDDTIQGSRSDKTLSHPSAGAEELPGSTAISKRVSVESGGVRQTSKKLIISSELSDKKHADDNLKRLQSVKERDRENRMKKAILKKALSSVDGVCSANKKIVFDSDDDFDLPTTTEPTTTVIKTKHNDKQQAVNTGPSLFDSEDDDAGVTADGEMFHLRQQYEGKAGRKLLALQSRIGADERFRLDERFADSEEENDNDHDEKNELSEKARNLKILESVVGRDKVYKLDYKKKQFKDIGAVRFDPSHEDHSQFEIKRSETEVSKNVTKPEKQKKKAKKGTEEVVEDELPQVDKTRHFEVSTSLKDAFKKSSSKESFSLLSAFGPSKNQSESSDEEDIAVKPSLSHQAWRQDNKSDEELMSASDNNEDGSETPAAKSVPAPPRVIFPVKNRTFFFTTDDERLKEGVQYFLRPANYEDVVRKWREKRRDLIDAFKLKHKRALKRLQSKNRFHKK